ncbi:Ionotropic glutamate receptor L-glutamate and glycine-binding domain [Trinorchestia longiramus]|nr:Ionotropic glutamate receptor L-glutamate and glycine-binding domain [Trinorchestia longiramus]
MAGIRAAVAAVSSDAPLCIRATAYFMPPYMTSDPMMPDKWDGVIVDVVDIIFEKMNWCYRVRGALDEVVGEQQPNGSWTGAIGEVSRGESDMVISPFLLNEQRNNALDVSDYLWPTSHNAVHKKAQVEPDIAGFIKPFSLNIWLYILGVFLACGCSLYFLLWTQARLGNGKSPKSNMGSSMTRDVRISFFSVLRLMLGQPAENDDRLSLSRVLVGTTMVSWLILGTMYKSLLMAMLVLPRTPEPFNSLEELVTKRAMPYLVVPGSFLHAALLEADPNSTLGRVYANIDRLEISYPKTVHYAVNGIYAALSSRSATYGAINTIFSQTRTCPLTLKDSFLTSWYAVGFTKNSPLLTPFNLHAQRLREGGILDKLERKWLKNTLRCLEADKEARILRPLDIRDFYGVFLLYVGGNLARIMSSSFPVSP